MTNHEILNSKNDPIRGTKSTRRIISIGGTDIPEDLRDLSPEQRQELAGQFGDDHLWGVDSEKVEKFLNSQGNNENKSDE